MWTKNHYRKTNFVQTPFSRSTSKNLTPQPHSLFRSIFFRHDQNHHFTLSSKIKKMHEQISKKTVSQYNSISLNCKKPREGNNSPSFCFADIKKFTNSLLNNWLQQALVHCNYKYWNLKTISMKMHEQISKKTASQNNSISLNCKKPRAGNNSPSFCFAAIKKFTNSSLNNWLQQAIVHCNYKYCNLKTISMKMRKQISKKTASQYISIFLNCKKPREGNNSPIFCFAAIKKFTNSSLNNWLQQALVHCNYKYWNLKIISMKMREQISKKTASQDNSISLNCKKPREGNNSPSFRFSAIKKFTNSSLNNWLQQAIVHCNYKYWNLKIISMKMREQISKKTASQYIFISLNCKKPRENIKT